jgi:hypothetical protein
MAKAHNAKRRMAAGGIRRAFGIHRALRSAASFAFLLVLAVPSFAEPGFGELWASRSRDYPGAVAFARPMPWQVGQFVLYGSMEKGERKAVFRTLIAGHEGGTWTVEIWTLDAKGRESTVQIFLSGYENAYATGDTASLQILGFRSRDKSGKMTEVDAKRLGPLAGSMKPYIAMMLGLEGPASLDSGTSLVVPAGRFETTGYGRGTFSALGRRGGFSGWYSSLVPINGAIRTESEEGKNVTVLLAFGFDGVPRM